MFFYQISTLTTGKDNFPGTALDDMFTAENAGVGGATHTLTAGDILDGGAGNDTLVLNDQGNVSAGLQTVKNIENLKVYQGAMDRGAWTGDVSEFAGLQNVEIATTNAVTLTAGASVTNVALNGAGATTLTGNGIANVSAQHMATGGATLTVENTTADHTLNVALDKVGSVSPTTGRATNVLTITDAAATTIALTSNGVENAVLIDEGSAALKNVTIEGKGDLALNTTDAATLVSIDGSKAEGDLDFTGTTGEIALNKATTTIKTGLGDDTFITGAVTGKVTIDTAAGDDDVVLGAAGKLAADSTISLGDGDDSLTMKFAALTKDLKIDGGTNTADGGDALIFSDAANFVTTTTKYDHVKDHGFEVFGVKGAALTADASKLGVTEFSTEGAGSLALTEMTNNSTVTFGAGTITASSLGMAAAGTLDLVLESMDTTIADAKAGVTTTKASTINVESTFDLNTTTAQNASYNILTLEAQVNAIVNLTGSQNLTYNNNGAKDQTINAGAFTGDLKITGNTGADTITGGTGANVIVGGAGIDEIDLKASADKVDTIGLNGITTANARDTVSGFKAGLGGDHIDFNTTAGNGSAVTLTEIKTTGTAVTFTATTAAYKELAFDAGATADLGNATNGTEVLKLMTSLKTGATAGETHTGYLVAYDDNNAYLYYCSKAVSSSSATGIEAGDINLVGTFTGVEVGAFDADNIYA